MQNLPVQLCRWNPEDTNSVPINLKIIIPLLVADAELFNSFRHSASLLAFGLQAQNRGCLKLVGVKGWFDDDEDDADDEADDDEEEGGGGWRWPPRRGWGDVMMKIRWV